MAQNPETMDEVLQVVETTKGATDQLEVNNAPESTVVAGEIPKPEEDVQPIDGEPVLQEEPDPTAVLEATEEGYEAEIANDLGNETSGQDVWPPTTEATDDLSPEERKLKLKKERKERLKHLASNRFMLPEEPIKTISFTGENIEEVGEIVEEEEEKQEILVNFDEPIDYELDTASTATTDESEEDLFKKIQTHRMVDLFPAGFSNAPVDKTIFYKDPKYDDSEDALSIAAISMISMRTLNPADPDSVQLKTNFLRDFDVPSLSDISEEHELSVQLSGEKSATSVHPDQGLFVDPTANLSSRSSSASESLVDLDHEQHDEEEAPDSQDDSSDMSDIPEFAELPDTPTPKQKGVTLDDFSALNKVEFEERFDEEDVGILHARTVKNVVRELILDLIEETAKRSDYHNQENVLRAKYDKKKLLEGLQKILDTYMIEKYTNEMMSNRLTEFYKRNRNARVFVSLSEENEKRYQPRSSYQRILRSSLKL